MNEQFEVVFGEVMEELGIQKWYELFESEGFAIVEKRCQALEGFDQEAFEAWEEEMAWAL